MINENDQHSFVFQYFLFVFVPRHFFVNFGCKLNLIFVLN